MGQLQLRHYEQILQRMINRVVARTSLNDLNDGSSVYQTLAAAAREDDEQYFQMSKVLDVNDILKAEDDDLDELAKTYNPAIITRLLASRATGQIRFSRTGIIGTITISIGTQVKVPSSGAAAEVVYVTTAVGTIPAGNTQSGLVDIKALNEGSSGNAFPNTITGFVTKPSGVDSVTNPSALTNGADKESNNSFRQRLVAFAKGLARAHIPGIEAAVINVEDPGGSGKVVRFAQAWEDPVSRGNTILYIDDGSGTAESTAVVAAELQLTATGGEVDIPLLHTPVKTTSPFTLTINAVPKTLNVDYTLHPTGLAPQQTARIKLTAASYPAGLTAGDVVHASFTYYTGLVQECQKIIDGDPADRTNYPGCRAGGVAVRVLPPTTTSIIVTANITVLNGFTAATVAVSVKAAISAYVNSLGIGEDVILAELIERSMAIPGMSDISFSEPTANRFILDASIARVSDSNITIS